MYKMASLELLSAFGVGHRLFLVSQQVNASGSYHKLLISLADLVRRFGFLVQCPSDAAGEMLDELGILIVFCFMPQGGIPLSAAFKFMVPTKRRIVSKLSARMLLLI